MSTILFGYWYLILVYSVESYEYGYHPSSEEFDSQVRGQTWTRDLLWREKNNKRFSPKFNLHKPKDALLNTDPERNPHHVSSSSENENMFLGYAESDTIALPSESVAEVNLNSFSNETVNLHNHSIFPIYFTNPSTGIVYAITEVGVDTSSDNSSRENGSIPIFVSKEQYERDMYLLKKTYETKCVRQRKPQIVNGNIVKSVKTKLTVHANRTHVSGGRKRKNRHRKAKKRKTFQKNKPETKPTNPPETTHALDTQLEKPNKVSPVPSVFSNSSPASKPRVNSTHNRIKGIRKPQPAKPVIHRVVRRSLSSKGKEANLDIAKSSKLTPNSTDSVDKPKKILSTQIQVTSEYLEPPTLNTRTPKNSIEENSHKEVELPQKSENPPCKKPPVAKDTADDEYEDEDYYNFDGTAYGDDQSDWDDSEDEEADESPEVKDSIISSEENISDYSVPEGINQEEDKYQLKKYTRKRIKRRRPYNDEYDDYDDDYDNESDDGVLGLFRGLFTPVQWVMDGIFDRAALMFNREPESESNYNRKPKYPQYTVYNSAANGVVVEENTSADKGNSFGSWLGSWFGLRKRRGVSTTPTPVEDEPGWLETWFGYDVRTPSPDEDESDPWFFGWFNSKPRSKRTTTTTTTTPMPILTIAEPLKNPHKWIGLLAQHIVNSTSTLNPIAETTTDNPEIPKKIAYDKYQIWRLKPTDDSEVKVLDEYKRSEEGVRMQWLKGPTLRGFTDVLIPPKMLIDFRGTLNFENIAHEILIFDVGKVISYEEAKQEDMIPNKPATGKAVMSWNRYYDYESIIKYLELTQLRNPQYVELIHIGRSFEGRPLVIAKLEMKKPKDKVTTKKKIKLSKKSEQANSVFIEAGIHGREWISPATATWMINELLKIMKNNRTNVETEYIKNTTWYIMPLSNPDSYEYSHQYDRFWKKSRSRHIAKPNGIINSAMTWLKNQKSEKVCFGVDLDHNWHYNWGKKGSSKSPCNEFFSGPTPFSEPETRALSKFLMDNRKQIKLFVSLQAYGQIISYPNKLNSSFQAQKLDDLLDVAMVGTDGLRKRGSKSRYKVDSMNDLIEIKSGSSDYFSSFEAGIPFAYTIHLADNGVHGFLLPGTYIEPTARDTFEIVTAMIDYI